MVVAGVLGLPFAMAQLGWAAGTVAIAASFGITLYTLWQMVEMHEEVPGREAVRPVPRARAARVREAPGAVAHRAAAAHRPGVLHAGVRHDRDGGTVLVKKYQFSPGLPHRVVARSGYVAFTMVVAMTFPFFDGLLGFFGGFGFAPTTYFIPCIIWLIIRKPTKYGFSWSMNIFFIIIGVLLMLVSPIGGFRQIILDASKYKFCS
uniref:Amino acid transporter transmembrane domain-containing protein n=1 Tax=Oryza brachyantha TaxID=4533 RepID=J3NAZ0_ORYBR